MYNELLPHPTNSLNHHILDGLWRKYDDELMKCDFLGMLTLKLVFFPRRRFHAINRGRAAFSLLNVETWLAQGTLTFKLLARRNFYPFVTLFRTLTPILEKCQRAAREDVSESPRLR